jgi:uncharacterized protein YuzB (UPF0349 family)
VCSRIIETEQYLFDNHQNGQIVDFCSNCLRGSVSNADEVSEADSDKEALQTDVLSFCSILFEILAGRRVVVEASSCGAAEIRFVDDGERAMISSFIPVFMRGLMERMWSAKPWMRPSFSEIYENLKEKNFDIVEGNEVTEVLRFVSSLEASE